VEGPVAFSPDGKALSTGVFDTGGAFDYQIPIWEVATGRLSLWPNRHRLTLLPNRHETSLVSAALSPNGRTLATWSGHSQGDGTLRLWDIGTGAERGEFIRLCHPGGEIRQVAFSPTGRYLATANGNGTVYILKVEDQ